MAAVSISSLLANPRTSGTGELSLHEALSGITGSISLVAWIVLLLPQLIENYKNGRADALSVAFLSAWFVGDLSNLIGAVWGGLLPTVIAIAIYYCFADCVLLSQTIYYKHYAKRSKEASSPSRSRRGRHHHHHHHENDPTQPLIRRPSPAHSTHRRRDSISSMLKHGPGRYSELLRNVFALLGVVVAGTAGWGFAWWAGAWKVQEGDGNYPDKEMPLGAEILGYASAGLYLSARIPQIIRNHQKKSCEGLSLLFFLLSLLGNLTYGSSILLHSTDKDYVLDNLPWLMGSLGTMAEDIIIFIQFRIYAAPVPVMPVIEDEESVHSDTDDDDH